jgi:uncharacterized protein YcbK (DUF882 family)
MKTSDSVITRRGLLCGLTALVGATAAGPAFASTPALLKGAGNFRSIKLVNNRTGDWINTAYWVDGQYIPEVMDDINYLMRDWRAEKVKKIDPRTIDILSATHRLLDCREPFEVISGYRTKQTNALLRKRSRGVASNSYHIKAMAVDISMKSRSVRQISRAGLSLGAGGVGKYSRSDFVHLDSGPVRTWGG